MPFVRLSELEVEQLRDLMRKTDNAYLYRRVQVVWLNYLGKSISEIVKITNMTERTIYRWLRLYKEKKLNGLSVDTHRRGRPSKITEEHKRFLVESVQMSPETFGYSADRWTLKLLAQHMALNTGIKTSFQRIWQILISYNIAFPMPRTYGLNPKYQARINPTKFQMESRKPVIFN